MPLPTTPMASSSPAPQNTPPLRQAPPPTDDAVWRRNIDALRAVVPATADRLLRIAPPDGLQRVLTRDGGETFCWPTDVGPRWLGRTSLPIARAAGLMEAFQPGSGNVLFAGCGADEIARLMPRLSPQAALFVVENDPVDAALVLKRHDLSAELADGRLVLLAGPDAWAQFAAFLRHHDGYLPPQRILAWPWFTSADQRAVTSTLSDIAADLARHRDERRRRLAAPADAASNAIAVVTPNADAASVRRAHDLRAAARELERPAGVFAADHPARMHRLALRRFLHESAPGVLLLVNAAPCDIDSEPAGGRVIVWLSEDFILPAGAVASCAAADAVVVSTPRQEAALKGHGRRVLRMPLAAAPRPQPLVSRRLLVLADAPPVDARAAGLNLSTQVALWDALAAYLRPTADQFRDDLADSVFAAVESRSGIRVADPDVRRGLLERFRHVLAPALFVRACCQALQDAVLEFDLCGSGWTPPESAATRWRGHSPPPDIAYDVAVELTTSGRVTARLLDAVAAGATPLLAGLHRESPAERAERLAPLSAEQVLLFRSGTELVERIRAAPSGPAAAAGHLRRAHLWRHRLATALGALETP